MAIRKRREGKVMKVGRNERKNIKYGVPKKRERKKDMT